MKKVRITFNSPVVLTFTIICLVVTILGMLSGDIITSLLFTTYHSSLLNPLTYVRFFTHVLGHIGWAHFIGNASFILLLGPLLEEKYGSKALIEVIIITALVTGLVNYLFFWRTALCGASGVVFAFILMASFTSFNEGELPLTFIMVAVIYIGEQLIDGIMVRDNISNMAHIVGGIVGAASGYLLNRKKGSYYKY